MFSTATIDDPMPKNKLKFDTQWINDTNLWRAYVSEVSSSFFDVVVVEAFGFHCWTDCHEILH